MSKAVFYLSLYSVLIILSSPALGFSENWQPVIADKIRQKYEPSATSNHTNHIDGLVRRFYQSRDFQPAWITKEGWTPLSKEVVETLRRANDEGLDAMEHQDGIDKMATANNSADAAFDGEIALTKAMLRYIINIKGGRLDPHTIDGEIYIKPEAVEPGAILQAGIASGTGEWIKTLCPPHPEYQALKALLATYRALPTDHCGPLISITGKLKRGDSSPAVIPLRRHLEKLGLLAETEDIDNSVFDASVETALKAYQARLGLVTDGVLGQHTLKLLNRNPSDYINQIIVTMERWRWMPEDLGQRHIQVNIARFELMAVADGKIELHSPIIVGLSYHETPQFSAPMTGIIFNPAWRVPPKIATAEKLPLIRKDPSYLKRNNYVLYDARSGDLERVDPEDIDWSTVSKGNFPYRLQQLPGSKNALGKIRFTILNPFDIYLHSTPQQYLFEKPSRALSHGCIRVKDYKPLAIFALNNPQKWNLTTVDALLDSATTRHIPLPQPLPVHIYYFTVGFNEKHEPYFMNDVYGQDAKIWKALEERRRQGLLIAKANAVESEGDM